MKLSIIIPVCNESKVDSFVNEVRKLDDASSFEVIVVDCSSKRSSVRGISDSSVVKLFSSKGRASQQNAGAKKARGDVLLFLHADTLLPKNALSLIKDALNDPLVVGGAFKLCFDSRDLLLRGIAYATNVRSRITRVPYGDQAIFIRSSVFKEIGGFPSVPFLEDVLLMERLRKGKYGIRILDTCVTTSPRKWESQGILKRTLKNRYIMFQHMFGRSPAALARQY